MKIALLNPTFLMRRPIAELARHLAAAGHQVTVIWPMDRQQSQTNQRHFDKLLQGAAGITVLPIWSKEIKAILWSVPTDWQLFAKLRQVARTHDVVQVWAPFYPLPLLPFLMKKVGLFPAPLIGTYDTVPAYSFSMGPKTDLLFRVFFRLTGPFLNAAERTTLYSDLLRPFAKQAGFKEEKLLTLPTGVATDPKVADADIRQELGLPADMPLILFIGLINWRKGVFRLLEIAEKLREKGMAFQLLLVGKGPQEEGLREAIRQRGLEGCLRLLGHRQDVHNFYRQASCLVLPAEGEGLPGVVMEAMSYGVPVVASDIPCLPDLVESGKSGYLHPVTDTEAFADSLARLVSHPETRQKLSQASLARIKEWQWEKRLPLYERLYSELSA